MRTGAPLGLLAMTGIQYLRAVIILEKQALKKQATKLLEGEGVFVDEHKEWTETERD